MLFQQAILLSWVIFSYLMVFLNAEKTGQPNIIFVLVDDLGWNDVSFHGSPQIPTPNLDAFAYEGIILNNYYVQPFCIPSSSALMTGKYPINTGLHRSIIPNSEPWGVPLNITLLPQCLKNLGYETYMIGKWRLGFHHEEFRPNSRGFDVFYGYWTTQQDYYDHTSFDEDFWENDLHQQNEVVQHQLGCYSTEVLTKAALDMIKRRNKTKPFFLYLSHHGVHTGNPYDPLQAPYRYVTPFRHIRNNDRRVYAGMVAAIDDSFGQLVKILESESMLENSIIIVSSDSGGHGPMEEEFASNYPLRGYKGVPWEGGVRATAFIWSPLLDQNRRTSSQLMHISDWLPTLYRAAGGNAKQLSDLDGIDMWEVLSKNLPSPRKEILLNADAIEGFAGLRMGDYKLIIGKKDKDSGNATGWFGNLSGEKSPVVYVPLYDACSSAGVLHRYYERQERNGVSGASKKWKSSPIRQVCPRDGQFTIPRQRNWNSAAQRAEVQCILPTNLTHSDLLEDCNFFKVPCLYNVKEDPCEYTNVAKEHPVVVQEMIKRLREILLASAPHLNASIDLSTLYKGFSGMTF